MAQKLAEGKGMVMAKKYNIFQLIITPLIESMDHVIWGQNLT